MTPSKPATAPIMIGSGRRSSLVAPDVGVGLEVLSLKLVDDGGWTVGGMPGDNI